ncbi:TIGR04197 family type VII secretion effector [Miniphocaeibacter massiliensis]|uniref:TIGR04197 family type VII secretion effector n=1 Tax=Miniphocaeibacter massiliensis TaxID=2041841 RepID=UPI000C1BC000|nr:TIGR04197 family type VII secretion effector [Miniphocaeibacter massiliensis]
MAKIDVNPAVARSVASKLTSKAIPTGAIDKDGESNLPAVSRGSEAGEKSLGIVKSYESAKNSDANRISSLGVKFENFDNAVGISSGIIIHGAKK